MKKYIISVLLAAVALVSCEKYETVKEVNTDYKVNFEAFWKMIDEQYLWVPRNDENQLWALGGRDDALLYKKLRQISPICYVKPGLSLPPFLILHGDADDIVLYEDSVALYDKLTENGYTADFVHVTNAPHEGNFWSEELLGIIFDFIKKNV